MKTYILLTVLLASLFSFCQKDVPQEDTTPTKEMLIGKWELISIERIDTLVERDWGKDVLGKVTSTAIYDGKNLVQKVDTSLYGLTDNFVSTSLDTFYNYKGSLCFLESGSIELEINFTNPWACDSKSKYEWIWKEKGINNFYIDFTSAELLHANCNPTRKLNVYGIYVNSDMYIDTLNNESLNIIIEYLHGSIDYSYERTIATYKFKRIK